MPLSEAPPAGLRERGKRERVERILAAARELLREAPEESPSAERIAALAGVSPATVFNLVGTRASIWAALASQLGAELGERAEALAGLPPRKRAVGVAAAAAELLSEDPSVYRHVLANWQQSAGLLQSNPAASLLQCLREAGAEGALRPGQNPERLGAVVTSACIGACHQWAAGLIDDAELRSRCVDAVELAFAD